MRIRKEGTKSEANASETPRISREQRRDPNTHSQENRQNRSRISALETGAIRLTVDEFEELCVNGYEVNPAIFFYGTVLGK